MIFFITVIDRIKYDVKMIFFYEYSSIETTKNMQQKHKCYF